jgi:hypothetical protein
VGSHRLWPAAAAMVAGVALVAGCAADDDSAPTQSTPSTTSPVPTETTADVRVIDVTVADGEITPPPDRIEVDEGVVVRIVVTSDEADAVHVHGYDREAQIPAGGTATIEFTADQTGLFEVELHELDKVLFQLQVQ